MSKIGICFSGGGARGAYQIGAVQALHDLGVFDKVKCMSGASIGSANAAVLASRTIEDAKKIWFDIPDNPLGKNKPILKSIKEEKLKVLDTGIYSMELFEEVLLKNVRIDQINNYDVFVAISESGDESKGIFELLKSSIRHYVKDNSKVHYLHINKLKEEEAIDAIKASCSIPVVFSPVTLGEKKYYDGGVFDNTPIQPLLDSGCDEIILINIAFFGTLSKIRKSYPDIILHEIKSKKKLGGVLDFTTKHSKRLYKIGYEDTIEYYKSIDQDTKYDNDVPL
jgi:NTE family protein